jgi:hypothetical protein
MQPYEPDLVVLRTKLQALLQEHLQAAGALLARHEMEAAATQTPLECGDAFATEELTMPNDTAKVLAIVECLW